MKRIKIALAAAAISGCQLASGAEMNFLSSKLKFPAQKLKRYAPCSDRNSWAKVVNDPANAEIVREIRKKAEEIRNSPIPQLRASDFALFAIEGNRKKYETVYWQKRNNLTCLVLDECFDGKKRNIPHIVDYIWDICSEHTWTVPAHILPPNGVDKLAPDKYRRNDLSAACTGYLLAKTLYLLDEELKAYSQNLVKIARRNIIDRIIVTFENDYDDWWYLGRNNWTTWCGSDILGTALLTLQDEPSRMELFVRRLTQYQDNFFRRYSDDGVCDEGPSYWTGSALAFFRYTELAIASGVLMPDVYQNEKLGAMLNYIANVHLGSGIFFSYSDSTPDAPLLTGAISLAAKRLEDEKIAAFATQVLHNFKDNCKEPVKKFPKLLLTDLLMELFNTPDAPYEKTVDNSIFYKSRGYLFCRSGKFGLGIKGGHNYESHNHNDVGHFSVVYDGIYHILDLGKVTYTRENFTIDKRYDAYPNAAAGHSMPLFDGAGEVYGEDKKPQSIDCSDDGNVIRYQIEAAGTYDEKCGAKSVRRTILFDRTREVITVTDSWQTAAPKNVECRFFTNIRPEKISDHQIAAGKLLLTAAGNGKFDFKEISPFDDTQEKRWGKLYCITIKHLKNCEGSHTLTITPRNKK